MGSLFLKFVYILTAMSIAADFMHLGSTWFNAGQHDGEISVQSSSLFLPGASGAPIWPWVGRYLSKSAIKAAKKRAKNQAKKAGRSRNKSRKSSGGAEHTKNARKSTSNKHQKGQARKNRDRQRAKGNRRG
nr:probable pre-mRNA-splicing factor ATP-dependent RNA helicase mog-5 [Pocillopora verrucosa]